jgi:hypothetical protein
MTKRQWGKDEATALRPTNRSSNVEATESCGREKEGGVAVEGETAAIIRGRP